jgi:hypothetical protein
MNRFDSLPDDIQEKIYHEVHKLNSKDLFIKIKKIEFWQRRHPAIRGMTNLLYHLGASKKELKDYFFCLDWLNGIRLNITGVVMMDDNLYHNVYYDYWDWEEESEYYNGDYL